jgi:hypothetical protein
MAVPGGTAGAMTRARLVLGIEVQRITGVDASEPEPLSRVYSEG